VFDAVVRRAVAAMPLLLVLLSACAPTPVRSDGYRLVFNDNFDGTALDTNNWSPPPYGSSLDPLVAFNAVTLKATAANNYAWSSMASTGLRSDTEPSYPHAHAWREGYVEARIRYTNSPWAWPAFWMFSMSATESWPNQDCSHLMSEWDLMENGVENAAGDHPSNHWYFTALHRNTDDGSPDGYCGQPDTQRTYSQDMSPKNLSDWHVWSGRWTSSQVCTYLDDVQLQCMPTWDTTGQRMDLLFTIHYLDQCDGCPPRPSELTMQVDWVRVWQK
jgi:hypothetical protein